MKKYLENACMKKKLYIVMGVTISIFMVAILVSIIMLVKINSNMTTFYHRPYQNSTLQMSIRKDMNNVARDILWATQTSDPVLTQERIDNASNSVAESNVDMDTLRTLFGNAEMIAQLDAAMVTLDEVTGPIIEYASNNQNAEALALYDSQFVPAMDQAQAVLAQIGERADTNALKYYQESQQLGFIACIAVIILSLASIIIGTLMTQELIKVINQPITELQTAAEQLSCGNLDIIITHNSNDELGSLANAFRTTCTELKLIIDDLGKIMVHLKDGDFRVKSGCEEHYVGDFQKIIDNLLQMVYTQSDVLTQIQMASSQVSSGSLQLASGAQTLAEGATEQAGAVQELTATIEEVTTASETNVTETAQSYEEAKTYLDKAEKGKAEMVELTGAMTRISTASLQVESIISEIEDIASQTNLLSLNASIEAARAGEAGKGFAVVADQIGKLANESAASASRTRELIQNELHEIESGNAMTEKTQEALGDVVAGIEYLSSSIQKVSVASKHQADTMREIERGIEQISSVVQSNSAAAEETSATSEELSAQATTLDELVAHFQLRK